MAGIVSVREMGRKGGRRNHDRNSSRWVARRDVADRQPTIAHVANSITIEIDLVRVERIRTIVYWADGKARIEFRVA